MKMPAKKVGTRKRMKKGKTQIAGKTRTFGGKRYTKKMCGRTKTAAKAAAKSHRAKGKSKAARVVKVGSKYCVYTRG